MLWEVLVSARSAERLPGKHSKKHRDNASCGSPSRTSVWPSKLPPRSSRRSRSTGREFQAITRRAKVRFEQRDWHGVQKDSLERLELYPCIIAHGVAQIRGLLGSSEKDKKLWAAMKSAYTKLIDRCQDIELAETFFNSVSRRIFTTIGVNPRIEFLFSDFDPPDATCEPPLLSTYSASGPLAEHIRQVLTACEFARLSRIWTAMLTWSHRPSSASAKARATTGRSIPST